MILLSLASKQIWPQVLSVAHLKPARVFLLHSDDATESKGPAQKLKRFFDDSGLVAKGNTRLERVSDSDFDAIERRLDELQREHRIPLDDCAVNITGGNKLMATAAIRWAARREMNSCYLERGNTLTLFSFQDGTVRTSSEKIDGHITDDLDPVALLRCQLDASEVERDGEFLTLTPQARDLDDDAFFIQAASGADATRWLSVSGTADSDDKAGDALELLTAAILLKLGVRRVQRSLRLKVKSVAGVGTRLPHAELDLLFVWGGRLWIVDCKDRKAPESLVEGLRRELQGTRLSKQGQELLARISKELSIGQTKVMKEDLLAVREAGGLLGNVICVRKGELPEEVLQYARHNGISVVRKSELVAGFRGLLQPQRPADGDEIARPAAPFRK